MMKYIYYNKKRKLIGLSLIETIVSMWILGIVIVSMLSFIGASMSKQNQLKIQAMSLAKSELQEAELDAMNRNANTHYTIILLKSSYLTKADKHNESDLKEDPIENDDRFYKKYVSTDGTNWEMIDSTHLDIIKSKEEEYTRNGPGAEKPIDFFEPIEKPISNPMVGIGTNEKDIPINDFISDVDLLFNSPNENQQLYKDLEEIAITSGYGIKCFVMKTTYQLDEISVPTTITTDNNRIINIPITVEIVWSSEKTKEGHHPLNHYNLQSQVTIIGDNNDTKL